MFDLFFKGMEPFNTT